MIDPGMRGRGGWLWLAAAAMATLACGEAPSTEVRTDAVSADGIMVCGQLWEFYQPGAQEPPNEWYSVPAMHAKLRHYPDFAAMAGVQSVSNCEQARQLYARYEEYLESHPDFDKDEPYDDPIVKPAFVPAPMDGSLDEVPKILNGTPSMLLPVVGTTHIQGSCTATFISKNFAVTAAHCIATKPGWVAGTNEESQAQDHGWYKYGVSFAHANGDVQGDVRNYDVLQYRDPHWLGLAKPQPTDGYSKADFAVLFFPETDDNRLPNNVPNASGNSVPYMRLSQSINVSTAASFWGFGGPDDDKLKQGTAGGYSIHPVLGVGVPNGFALFEGAAPSGTNVPYVCHGDSGGPLVDRYDITDSSGGVSAQYVEVGLLSDWRPRPPGECADSSSYTIQWADMQDERKLIGDIIESWFPKFRCIDKKSNGNTSPDPDYFECWGKPCKGLSDCASDEVCVNPGSAKGFKGPCTGCGEADANSCACIYGQCMKK